jgi:hypothetical protein
MKRFVSHLLGTEGVLFLGLSTPNLEASLPGQLFTQIKSRPSPGLEIPPAAGLDWPG